MAQTIIQKILTDNDNWQHFYTAHEDKIRDGITYQIEKLLGCRQTLGYKQYICINQTCQHIKRVPHTCKSRSCSSCGKKATQQWIEKQKNQLPQVQWQHITFTMPSDFWALFWTNRELLNQIAKIAAHAVITLAKQKGYLPGIFIAIHTFGRDLKRNVHIHLSTTYGGITENNTWKTATLNQWALMRIWRYQVVKLFREAHRQNNLITHKSLRKIIEEKKSFNLWLNAHYQKKWIVHCSKPQKNHKKIVSYLGRYVKRPPIALSKLKHYDGFCVKFRYLNHALKIYETKSCSVFEFIKCFIRHIPDKNFRLIRYYGFLANRVKGKYLAQVNRITGQITQPDISITWALLLMKSFNKNPLICDHCGNPLYLQFHVFPNRA